MKLTSDEKTREVAANIRKIRQDKNYKQDFLAAKLDMSQNAYSKIELGRSNITLARLIQITEILEVDMISILKPVLEDSNYVRRGEPDIMR